jgi:hypothetical protein
LGAPVTWPSAVSMRRPGSDARALESSELRR